MGGGGRCAVWCVCVWGGSVVFSQMLVRRLGLCSLLGIFDVHQLMQNHFASHLLEKCMYRRLIASHCFAGLVIDEKPDLKFVQS